MRAVTGVAAVGAAAYTSKGTDIALSDCVTELNSGSASGSAAAVVFVLGVLTGRRMHTTTKRYSNER